MNNSKKNKEATISENFEKSLKIGNSLHLQPQIFTIEMVFSIIVVIIESNLRRQKFLYLMNTHHFTSFI